MAEVLPATASAVASSVIDPALSALWMSSSSSSSFTGARHGFASLSQEQPQHEFGWVPREQEQQQPAPGAIHLQDANNGFLGHAEAASTEALGQDQLFLLQQQLEQDYHHHQQQQQQQQHGESYYAPAASVAPATAAGSYDPNETWEMQQQQQQQQQQFFQQQGSLPVSQLGAGVGQGTQQLFSAGEQQEPATGTWWSPPESTAFAPAPAPALGPRLGAPGGVGGGDGGYFGEAVAVPPEQGTQFGDLSSLRFGFNSAGGPSALSGVSAPSPSLVPSRVSSPPTATAVDFGNTSSSQRRQSTRTKRTWGERDTDGSSSNSRSGTWGAASEASSDDDNFLPRKVRRKFAAFSLSGDADSQSCETGEQLFARDVLRRLRVVDRVVPSHKDSGAGPGPYEDADGDTVISDVEFLNQAQALIPYQSRAAFMRDLRKRHNGVLDAKVLTSLLRRLQREDSLARIASKAENAIVPARRPDDKPDTPRRAADSGVASGAGRRTYRGGALVIEELSDSDAEEEQLAMGVGDIDML